MKTYKGHKFDNTVIEVLTAEHGKNVVKPFWESQGINDCYPFLFNACLENNNQCRYYGLKDGIFDNYKASDLQGVKIITLPIEPETPAYPYLAKCWDNDEKDFTITYVVGKIEIGNPDLPICCVHPDSSAWKLFKKGEEYQICAYKHAEYINETFESVSAKHEQLKKKKVELYKELNDLIKEIEYYSTLERILINE